MSSSDSILIVMFFWIIFWLHRLLYTLGIRRLQNVKYLTSRIEPEPPVEQRDRKRNLGRDNSF